MAAPNVTNTILENGLGVAVASPASTIWVVGPASSGSNNVATKIANIKTAIATFGYGRGIEAACYLKSKGCNVIFTKGNASATGSSSAVTSSATGASVVTIGGTPLDDYDFILTVTTGGTIGTRGIKFTVSADGGFTNGGVISIGTNTSYLVPNTGITFSFTSSTMVAGDTHSASCRAATMDAAGSATDYKAAFDQFYNSSYRAGIVLCTDPVTDTILEGTGTGNANAGPYTMLTAWEALNRFMVGLCTFRQYIAATDTSGITGTTSYASAFIAMFGDEDYHGRIGIGASYGRVISAINGRELMRPVTLIVAERAGVQKLSESAGYVGRGPASIKITNSNGTLLTGCYDERVHTTLDAERAITLTTYDDPTGVYVTRPLMIAADGTDFQELPERRVVNEVARLSTKELMKRVNGEVRIDKTTGFILEADAVELENAVTRVLEREVVAKGNASGASCVVSRTDVILSTKTLTVDTRTIPNGRTEYINQTIALTNPALAVAAAAPAETEA